MSSTSFSDKEKKLPTLTGENYREWADAMKGFLMFNGCWYLIEDYGATGGTGFPRPQAGAAPELIAAWDEKNEKAMGSMLMFVSANLKHHLTPYRFAFQAWAKLKAEYESPGAVGAFVNFQALFNSRLI